MSRSFQWHAYAVVYILICGRSIMRGGGALCVRSIQDVRKGGGQLFGASPRETKYRRRAALVTDCLSRLIDSAPTRCCSLLKVSQIPPPPGRYQTVRSMEAMTGNFKVFDTARLVFAILLRLHHRTRHADFTRLSSGLLN